MSTTFPIVFAVHGLTMIVSLAVMIYYIVHAIKDPELASEYRIIWILVIIMAGVAGTPVSWWMRIWNAPEPDWA